ncbi:MULTISPECIES: YeeE/YedE thiosulfate transporter family protein [Pseudomonas]|uniref:YeeE/YedE family protein n=1 Tax=Pseudomonas TaxID=286 RepID=UPI0023D85C9A|nr:YeeE/YedE thiosulfate transporter family protein [Pseudomonas sp. PSE14]WEJ74216.1 YeeE/YedE family protein [Pseudomonas sp. PSE14]
MIDWSNFTPWSALAGGALIGLSAGLFAVLDGRIAGISGLLGGLFKRAAWGGEGPLFLLGLLVAPLLWAVLRPLPEIRFEAGWTTLLLAGLLVGVGSRFGSGCTSGHGVCGLSRLSGRSLVATLCFMATGFITVFVLRHLLGA